MKITKEGIELEFEGKCDICECEFTYTHKDVKEREPIILWLANTTSGTNDKCYVKCPNCNKTCYVPYRHYCNQKTE